MGQHTDVVFKNLVLHRPLAIIDTETTGVDTEHDRIVELYVCVIVPYFEQSPNEVVWRLHPGRPIPPAASVIHGITDADIATAPVFDLIAGALAELLEGCDILGYNCLRFDLPLLASHFRRAGRPMELYIPDRCVIDPYPLFESQIPQGRHALRDAVLTYLGREHDGAHSAAGDARAAAEVLDAMLSTGDFPKDVPGLAEMSLRESVKQRERFESRRVNRWLPRD